MIPAFMTLVLLCSTYHSDATVYNEDSVVLETVLAGYNPSGRPVQIQKDAVNVTIYITAVRIYLEEIEQQIGMNAYFFGVWHDYRLPWNSSNGVEQLRVPCGKIWTPWMFAMRDQGGGATPVSSCVVKPNGEVNMLASMSFKVPCLLDMSYFPFDKQKCTITLISIGHLENQISMMVRGGVDTAQVLSDPVWNFEEVSVKPIRMENPMASIVGRNMAEVGITLKRKSLYFWITVMLPIAACDAFCLLGILLPRDGGERTGLLVALILTIFVFFTYVITQIPPSSDSVPLMTIYILFIILKAGGGLLWSLFSATGFKSYRGGPPPLFLLSMFRLAPNCTKVESVKEIKEKAELDEEDGTNFNEIWDSLIDKMDMAFIYVGVIWSVIVLLTMILISEYALQ